MAWAQIPNRAEREAAPFTPEIADAAAASYFRNYTQHFGSGGLRDAFASIPLVHTDQRMAVLPVMQCLFSVKQSAFSTWQHTS